MSRPSDDDRVLETGRLAELGMLTASLIHELRQPLFALKAFAELLRQRPDLASEYAERLLEQASTMESLLDGYGDFSRRPGSNQDFFDVRAPLRSALVILERRAHAAGVLLEVDFGEVPGVLGSALALQQAVVNLGANAIDAVRGQEGAWVRVGCRTVAGQVCIDVADNGPGLPQGMRENLFEPFRTTKVGGTGLGLVLTRQLLEICQGELRLMDGTGTWWELRLPVAA